MNYKARIDIGEEFSPEIEKMFWDNIGSTPICCATLKKLNEKIFVKCDAVTGDVMSEEDFEKFCLGCQMKIAIILFRKQTEGKNVKDYTEDDKRKLNKTVRLITRLAGNMC